MVARAGAPLVHARFLDLPRFLRRGDLLVVNESATLPAALKATRADGTRVDLHLSTPEPRGDEERAAAPAPNGGNARVAAAAADGATADAARAAGALDRRAAARRRALPRRPRRRAARARRRRRAVLVAPYVSPGRLWTARLLLPAATARVPRRPRRADPLLAPAARSGRSPTTRRSSPACPAAPRCRAPAGRSPRAARLARVGVARLVLHTGVSSQERGERPYPERFDVPAETAARVNAARAAGGRVIAVGTTVARALETVAAPDGTVSAGSGWTSLDDHAGARRARRRRADHRLARARREPPAAARGASPAASWSSARTPPRSPRGYRWHEFGDSHLLLRDRS